MSPDREFLEWVAGHPERQRVWLDGFNAGIAVGKTLGGYDRGGPAAETAFDAGVTEGRRQVEAEDAQRWADLQPERDAVKDLVSRRPRRSYPGPGLSGDEVRSRAARSWGLEGRASSRRIA